MESLIKNPRWSSIIIIAASLLIAFAINACKQKSKAQPSSQELQNKRKYDSLEILKKSVPTHFTDSQRREAIKRYESIYKTDK